MRTINIDLSRDSHCPQKVFGGNAGEHNESKIIVKLPERMIQEDISYYYFEFQTALGEHIVSPNIYVNELIDENKISITLWEQLIRTSGDLQFCIDAVKLSTDNTVTIKGKTSLCTLQILKSTAGESTLIDVNSTKEDLQEAIDSALKKAKDSGDFKGDPGEVSLSYANSNFANALKGRTNGNIVGLTDVSPVQHNLGVKLSSDTVTDLTSVKLKKFGANMLDLENVTFSSFQPGATWNIENGNIEFNAASNSFFYSRNISAFNLKPNCTYTCTTTVTLVDNGSTNLGGAGTMGLSLLLQTNASFDSSGKGKVYIINGYSNANKAGTYKLITTFTTPADMTDFTYIVTRLADNTTVTFSNIQIQAGTMSSDYEPYVDPVEYTPNADGTVEGVTSIYPATNLTTDTDGVTIGCTYNRDINKAFAELQAAILSTSANV